MINRKELIKKYLEFFKEKNHKIIPNVSLIPKDDTTTLFISAGMQPLVPYLLGKKHPSGKRLVGIQKCIRTTDIEGVGDEVHHTFFEMLGNWSLGDYWKEGAIKYTFDFYTKALKTLKERLAVTIFAGDDKAPKDEESRKIWKELGISERKIITLTDTTKNWWGPAGKTGPCGPSTEIFYWRSNDKPAPKNLDIRTFDEEYVEVGNDVLMEYIKKESGNIVPAKQKNIDFGGGVERTLAALNGIEDNYMTEVWKPIIKEIEKLSKKRYKGNERAMRIIADHIKASVFIIADGVVPSNTQQGYVLRRLIRRAIKYGKDIGIANISKIAEPVFKIYDDYLELKDNLKNLYILKTLKKEEEKFNLTLEKGLNIIKKKFFNKAIGGIDPENRPKRMIIKGNKLRIRGEEVFYFYQSHGFPIELTQEIMKEWGVEFDEQTMKEAQEAFRKHQKLSKTSAKGKFSSGLADNSEQTIRLHTATHLLNEALRKTLNKNIKQKGSNITPERLRFDFNFDRKLTDKEIKKVEDLVNKKISEKIKVTSEEMPLKKAIKIAQAEFGARYPDTVSVYSIGNFSKEICTGPHVKNTRDTGKFKIIKEESSAAGVRRIKAVVG